MIQNIAIIGAGHMGMCLLGGLISKNYPPANIFLADPSFEKLENAEQQYHIHTTPHNIEATQTANVIIFAVKPDVINPLATELANSIQKQKPLVISIAAGIRESHIQQWLGNHVPIIRAMPNTPALINCGATALYANDYVSHEQRQQAESILKTVGITVWLANEAQMDAVTALSGSGPAYFYFLIEAMQQAGEKLGLPSDIARLLTLQTAYGASRLALESRKPAAELCQQAMTPGGTTEQAIRVLNENKCRDIVAEAVNAAAKRSEELGK
jgi:pyrroline-5-carboxylate reductase